MADASKSTVSPGPARRAPWLRKLAYVALGLLGLLVAAYFVLSSSGFLKAVVLPRVGRALQAEVTVDDLNLSPFSSLRLRNLRVRTTGDAPLLRAEEVLVRYGLLGLIRGHVTLPEVLLVKPEIYVTRAADGHSNLDPLMAGSGEAASTRRRSSALQLAIERVTVRGGALTFVDRQPGGAVQTVTVTNLDCSASNIRNDGTGKFQLSSLLSQSNAAAGRPADQLQARLDGQAEFLLASDLQPKMVKGDWRLNVQKADGALREIEGLQAALTVDLTPAEVREIGLRFQRQGQSFGSLRLNGPLAIGRREGRLSFEIKSIGRAALNLVGAPLGLDFGETTISATGFFESSARGTGYAAKLDLDATRFSVRQGNLVTPAIDLHAEARGNTDLAEDKKVATLDRLVLTAKAGARELLYFGTERAVNFSWGGKDNRQLSTVPAILNLRVSDLALPDWRPFLGTNVLDGVVNVRGRIICEDDARKISLRMTNTVDRLGLAFGGTEVRDAAVALTNAITLTDYRTLSLERSTFAYREADQLLVSGDLTANYDPRSNGGNVQLSGTGDWPKFLARHPLPAVKLDSGKLRLNLLLGWKGSDYSGTVAVILSEIAGTVGGYRLKEYSSQFDASAELSRDKIMLQRVALTAREGITSGGSLDLVGSLDGANQKAQLSLNVTGLNQAALRAFVAPALATHDLASVSIAAHGDVDYAAPAAPPPTGTNAPAPLVQLLDALAAGTGEAALQLQGTVTNLVLRDRQTTKTTKPVGFGLQLDARRRGNVYQLGTNVLQLAATARGKNELRLGGVMDLSPSNAAPSELNLRADSLDLTPLFDLLLAAQLNTNLTAAPAPAARVPAQPEVEPDPIHLEPRQLTADLKVGRLFLRDLIVSNWTARVAVTNDRVQVAPFSLTLNDAPVNATAAIDLGKPGYVYELALGGDKVPLDPFLRSFAPQRVGQFGGDVSATGRVAGAGITGASLQKSLRAEVGFTATNLNLALSDVHSKVLKTVVNSVLTLPDLIRNPTATLGNLLGSLGSGGSVKTNAWVDQLAKAPIGHLALQVGAANGRVDVLKAEVSSPAFRAEATGTVTLAAVLTNSPVRLPVALWLRQPLAESIGVTAAGAPESSFVRLPDFLTVAGTIGAPKSDINASALVALTAKAGASLLKGTGNKSLDKAADTLGIIGNLVGGKSATNTPAAPSTNAPGVRATNAPAANALDLLLNSLPKKK